MGLHVKRAAFKYFFNFWRKQGRGKSLVSILADNKILYEHNCLLPVFKIIIKPVVHTDVEKVNFVDWLLDQFQCTEVWSARTDLLTCAPETGVERRIFSTVIFTVLTVVFRFNNNKIWRKILYEISPQVLYFTKL